MNINLQRRMVSFATWLGIISIFTVGFGMLACASPKTGFDYKAATWFLTIHHLVNISILCTWAGCHMGD